MFDMFSEQEETKEWDLLISFRKGVIPSELCGEARLGLRGAARMSKNRGTAAGKIDLEKLDRDADQVVIQGTRLRYYSKDGIISDTVEANPVRSGIAGFFGKTVRNPYCRQTAYTKDNFALFSKSFPFIQAVSNHFKEVAPVRWGNQKKYVEEKGIREGGWVVPDTVFTSITVNKDFQTAVHKDAGDLHEGFGNLTVLEGGNDTYKGGYTCLPKFRVAVDVRTGDFLGMDVHNWHGNIQIESAEEGKDDWERISVVCYCRADVAKCGTQLEEKEKYETWLAQRRNPKEQHTFRVGKHLEEKQKDADFMGEFGVD